MTPQTALFIGGDHDGKMLPMENMPPEYRIQARQKLEMRFKGDFAPIVQQSYKHYSLQDVDGGTVNLYVSGGNVNQPLRQRPPGRKHERP